MMDQPLFVVQKSVIPNMLKGTNRILRAAKKAGMNELTPVPYPKIQEEYLEMFKTPLNPAELKKYFGCKHAKVVIIQWMKEFTYLPAECNDSSVMMVQLRLPWAGIDELLRQSHLNCIEHTKHGELKLC